MKGQSVCTSEPFLHLWRLFACGWFLLPLSPLSPSDSSEPSVSVTKQWKPSAGQRFNKPRSHGLYLKHSILILNVFFYFYFELQEKVHICGTRRRKRLNTTWTRHFYTLQALKLDDDTTDVSRNICLTSKTKISFLVLIIWRKTPKYCEAEDVTDEQTNQNKPRLLD